jgi:hypothetical protein
MRLLKQYNTELFKTKRIMSKISLFIFLWRLKKEMKNNRYLF